MGTVDATRLLRSGLLDGQRMLLAGTSSGGDDRASLGAAVQATCAALGARVLRFPPLAAAASHEALEAECADAVLGALEEMVRIDMLVVDAAAVLLDAQEGSPDAQAGTSLAACLAEAWTVTRSVFNLAFLPAGRGGRILYLAPGGGGGESEPARAGLENLARTLSIEWARHGVTSVTIAPGPATGAEEVAAVSAYLASPAGAYFSGCLLDLRGPGART